MISYYCESQWSTKSSLVDDEGGLELLYEKASEDIVIACKPSSSSKKKSESKNVVAVLL